MANVEELGALERRVSMSVPAEDIERKVDERLKQLARNVKMAGFRPGKVPLKLVAQTYGPQVRSEVLSDTVQKAFTDVVREAKLKVAGYPRIEKKSDSEFSATFEIYPEVKVGDLGNASIERPSVAVDDAALDRTIEILRKQRARFVAASRPALDGDRLTVDFEGTIDGQPFEGGKAEGFVLTVGEGRMLPEFEAAARGMSPGERKTFTVKFPDDYHGKAVAGKSARFDLVVQKLEEPQLPELDGEFAPIWNPEFFGNMIIVNGNTWPFQTVEQRRYRFRFLNGCQSRFLYLDFSQIPGVEVWQIGNEGGFLAAPVNLTADHGNLLLMGLAERADVIVDFSNVPPGSYVLDT